MKAFETFREIDSGTGVETWRAYFTDDCTPNQVGDWMPKPNAPVGRGDTELEAIANLCIRETKRIKQEIETEAYNKRVELARYAPMTASEWEVLKELYWEGQGLCFYDTKPCERLQDKGYVRGIRFDGPREWSLTEEGKQYYMHYYGIAEGEK